MPKEIKQSRFYLCATDCLLLFSWPEHRQCTQKYVLWNSAKTRITQRKKIKSFLIDLIVFCTRTHT